MRARVTSYAGAFVLLATWSMASAQIPVTDAVVGLQSTITAVQTVIMVGNQLLELTGLGSIVLGDDLSGDIQQLAALAEEGKGLTFDIVTIQQQLGRLFDLQTAPSSSRELQARLVEIRKLTWTLYCDAMAVQSLLQSSLSALKHLVKLVEGIGELGGNRQNNQTLVQLESALTVQLAKLRAETGAYQRAQITDRLSEPLIMESMRKVNEQLMSDWPRD